MFHLDTQSTQHGKVDYRELAVQAPQTDFVRETANGPKKCHFYVPRSKLLELNRNSGK